MYQRKKALKNKRLLKFVMPCMGIIMLAGSIVGVTQQSYLKVYALEPVSYMEASYNGTQNTYTRKSVETYTVLDSSTTNWITGWYVLDDDITINDHITVTGTVNLILCDGSVLDVNDGIGINFGNELNIYAQELGTGELDAEANTNNGSATIGGEHGYDAGDLTIHGGVVSVTGNTDSNSSHGYYGGSAAIGGSVDHNGGTVEIYGGNISVRSYWSGAGIGGGAYGEGGDVTIYGGTVSAITGSYDNNDSVAAIGAGYNEDSHGALTVGTGITVKGDNDIANRDNPTIEMSAPFATRYRYMKVEGAQPVVVDDDDDDNTDTVVPDAGKKNDKKSSTPSSDSSSSKSSSKSHNRHVHDYEWVMTQEPTPYEDGVYEYRCKGCGHVADTAKADGTAALMNAMKKAIEAAPENGTVRLDCGYYMSLNRAVAEAHDLRPDVTVIFTFLDKGVRKELTIPAGTLIVPMLNEYGWAGFLFIGGQTGVTLTEVK